MDVTKLLYRLWNLLPSWHSQFIPFILHLSGPRLNNHYTKHTHKYTHVLYTSFLAGMSETDSTGEVLISELPARCCVCLLGSRQHSSASILPSVLQPWEAEVYADNKKQAGAKKTDCSFPYRVSTCTQWPWGLWWYDLTLLSQSNSY